MSAVLGFYFNLIWILVPTIRNPGPSLIPMGRKYKMFLGVPGSFFLYGWQWCFYSWAVPGGFGGMKMSISMVHLTLFLNLITPSIYSYTEHHCRLPCQTSAMNLNLNSIAICTIMVQTLCQNDALYVSRCCADIGCIKSKKGDFFLQETMPCIHEPSLYV